MTALPQEHIDFIKQQLPVWLSEIHPPPPNEWELYERVVRVEEELKHQRELMQQGFELMEKRFDQIDKRFEQVDKRFEQVDKRFGQADQRFESLQQDIRQLNQRMDRFMVWSFGTTLTVGGLIVALVKFWNPVVG